MSFQPNWRYNATGLFPFDARLKCTDCHEPFVKRHGVRVSPTDEKPMAMAWVLFGTGPRCYWCHLKAWNDPDFMTRSGSNEYAARNHDLNYDFRPRFPSIADELKKL
jgi:hypothetical protein